MAAEVLGLQDGTEAADGVPPQQWVEEEHGGRRGAEEHRAVADRDDAAQPGAQRLRAGGRFRRADQPERGQREGGGLRQCHRVQAPGPVATSRPSAQVQPISTAPEIISRSKAEARERISDAAANQTSVKVTRSAEARWRTGGSPRRAAANQSCRESGRRRSRGTRNRPPPAEPCPVVTGSSTDLTGVAIDIYPPWT